jgi:hypothetical protein
VIRGALAAECGIELARDHPETVLRKGRSLTGALEISNEPLDFYFCRVRPRGDFPRRVPDRLNGNPTHSSDGGKLLNWGIAPISTKINLQNDSAINNLPFKIVILSKP